ncbi:hypothetical protein A2U01_0052116, partial [Trifolium medium]|nr:hypothetical protein [Trifolium medium]
GLEERGSRVFVVLFFFVGGEVEKLFRFWGGGFGREGGSGGGGFFVVVGVGTAAEIAGFCSGRVEVKSAMLFIFQLCYSV